MTLPERIERDGYAVLDGVIPASVSDALTAALSSVSVDGGAAEAVASRGESVYAIRNLLEVVPEVARLARSAEIRALVEPILGADAFAVRGILFDKTPEANWKVPCHQDLTIAVRERIGDAPGFGPWSEKAGIAHVQPPVAILERMLTVRLHLDDCGAQNGPVQVMPGSHRAGRLSAADIAEWRRSHAAVPCLVRRGGALVMRPLLLHASAPSRAPARRRVVHLEFAASELPFGMAWHDRW